MSISLWLEIFSMFTLVFKNSELAKLNSELESIYAKAEVCNTSNPAQKCLSLDPDLSAILKTSRNYDELLYVWKGWHDATGPKMRKPFAKTVVINNKAAVQNNYKDLSENWLEDYEDPDFEAKMDKLFNEIKPIYNELHKYVKRKLDAIYLNKYPTNHNPELIQAHLLGKKHLK